MAVFQPTSLGFAYAHPCVIIENGLYRCRHLQDLIYLLGYATEVTGVCDVVQVLEDAAQGARTTATFNVVVVLVHKLVNAVCYLCSLHPRCLKSLRPFISMGGVVQMCFDEITCVLDLFNACVLSSQQFNPIDYDW